MENSSVPSQEPLRRAFSIRQVISLFVIVIIGGLVAIGASTAAGIAWLWATEEEHGYDFSGCSVVGIDLRGELAPYDYGGEDESGYWYDITSSEEVTMILDAARAEEGIGAVLLQVDSGGGYPIAGEEIAKAVQEFGKPSVALVRSMAASAAYWAVLPATTIIASEVSDVGSIGVTASYLEATESNEMSGLKYNELISGKYKDLGSPDKPLTEEERALVQRDLDLVRDAFVREIAKYRELTVERVNELADGSTLLGVAAKDAGLIDQVGGRAEAWTALRELTGEEPVVCWPQYN